MGRQGRQSSLDELSPTIEVSRDTSGGQWKSGSLGMSEFIKFAVKKKNNQQPQTSSGCQHEEVKWKHSFT